MQRTTLPDFSAQKTVLCKKCKRRTLHEIYKVALTEKKKIWGFQYVCTECGHLRSSIPTSPHGRKAIKSYEEFRLSGRTKQLFESDRRQILVQMSNRWG